MIKENTESLFDVSDTLTQIKTNKVISILTIFTVILGILTRLSGMYGMNVKLPFDSLNTLEWNVMIQRKFTR